MNPSFIEVFATKEQIKQSEEFAKKCYELRKSAYAERGQYDKKTIIKQIQQSKILEFAVRNWLRETLPEYIKVKQPSIELLERPSFDTDCYVKNTLKNDLITKINIKHQPEYSLKRYGYSWVFQKKDKLFETKQNEILVMGVTTGNKFKIISFGKVIDFKPFLGKMKEDRVADNKKAIYYENNDIFDIKNKSILNILEG